MCNSTSMNEIKNYDNKTHFKVKKPIDSIQNNTKMILNRGFMINKYTQ